MKEDNYKKEGMCEYEKGAEKFLAQLQSKKNKTTYFLPFRQIFRSIPSRNSTASPSLTHKKNYTHRQNVDIGINTT